MAQSDYCIKIKTENNTWLTCPTISPELRCATVGRHEEPLVNGKYSVTISVHSFLDVGGLGLFQVSDTNVFATYEYRIIDASIEPIL